MKNIETAKATFIKALGDFRNPAIVGKLQNIQFEQSQTFTTKELTFGLKQKDVKVLYNDLVKGTAHLQVQSDNICVYSMCCVFNKQAKTKVNFTLYLPFELVLFFNKVGNQSVNISQFTHKYESYLYFELPELDLYFSINVSKYPNMRENIVNANYNIALSKFAKYELDLQILPTIESLTIQKFNFNPNEYTYRLEHYSDVRNEDYMAEQALENTKNTFEGNCINIPNFGECVEVSFQKKFLTWAYKWLNLNEKNTRVEMFVSPSSHTAKYQKPTLFVNPKNQSWAVVMPFATLD